MTQKPIRFDQILPSYVPHDAIGNHVTLMRELLEKRGFQSQIFTELLCRDGQYPSLSYKKYPNFASRDAIIVNHFSVGSSIQRFMLRLPAFTICSYHNITPHHYFANWDMPAYTACLTGRQQFPIMRSLAKMTWSVSEFNRQELMDQGIAGPHLVFPVLRNYERLSKHEELPELAAKLSNRKNILFVGRITPHKGQFDLVFFAKILKQQLNQNIRLILVGSGQQEFKSAVIAQAREFGLSVSEGLLRGADVDILTLNDVSDSELAQIYRSSQLFLSLSEHEGFCVPLVEAMNFGLPILAHKAAAVPETLGLGGDLVNKFDLQSTITKILEVISSPDHAKNLSQKALARSKDFSWANLEQSFDRCLEETLNRFHAWYLNKPPGYRF